MLLFVYVSLCRVRSDVVLYASFYISSCRVCVRTGTGLEALAESLPQCVLQLYVVLSGKLDDDVDEFRRYVIYTSIAMSLQMSAVGLTAHYM